MSYINNNNTNTVQHFHDNNRAPEKNYFVNRQSHHNQEYLSNHDPDYSNLLKQIHQDTSADELSISKRKSNICDINTGSMYQYRELYADCDRNMNENWIVQNDKQSNSLDSLLNPSDDEALENYLNDLARNYDDIDRRIRNAETFVSQLEDPQNSNAFHGQDKYRTVSNSSEKLDEQIDKQVKYVTELRVNIADTIKNEKSSNSRDYVYNSGDLSPTRINSFGASIKHYHEPTLRRIPSSTNEGNHLFKSKCTNVSTNQNYTNKINDFQIAKSRSSSVSNSAKLDLEYVNIPPPKIFSSNYSKNENSTKDKEIQTIDYFGNRYNFLSQTLYENRAVQTVSLSYTEKMTVDMSVGTESRCFKPRLKPKYPKTMMSTKSAYDTDVEFSDSEKSDVVSTSIKNDFSEIVLEGLEHEPKQLKSALSKNVSKTKPTKTNVNHINFKGNHANKIVELSDQNNLKSNKSEKWKRSDSSNVSKSNINKTQKKSLNRKLISEDNDNAVKIGSKVDFEQETLETQDSAKNASLEIQRLLENLGTHLQASMSMREPLRKSSVSTDSSTPSFWDNPLCKNDLINTKIIVNNVTTKQSDSCKKPKRTSNIINSELQAICKTMEKNKKYDNIPVNIHESSNSDNASIDSLPNNLPTLRSESMEMRQIRKPSNSPTRNGDNIKKSTSSINATGDVKFPSNFKVFRSFELNPYDDIIKAHLSPFDRRVKSVAAKNGCRIAIDGPINAYDPLSCQAFRNKVTYRCTVAGPNKENLDKCMNYLKETFPNTFLKVNARSG